MRYLIAALSLEKSAFAAMVDLSWGESFGLAFSTSPGGHPGGRDGSERVN